MNLWLIVAAVTLLFAGTANTQNSGLRRIGQPVSAPAAASQSAPVTLIARGYLHTNRSRIVDSHGNTVRLDCVGWGGGHVANARPEHFEDYRQMTRAAATGFNCLRLLTNDASFEESNVGVAPLDAIVQYAGRLGLKVIIDHHNDEGGHNVKDNWGAQQKNGLWFDRGRERTAPMGAATRAPLPRPSSSRTGSSWQSISPGMTPWSASIWTMSRHSAAADLMAR